ncbi:uncharacterized protein M421DRAFT_264518 [Didymella exigua CBS 183.55]|uniref:Rhodopsin domain-containing protein n=1 Tax=Didymella exigua CBS 183.55 TaxID=1150837 RepID=A0A6A5RCZ6_9PLEO|nr:uncharacterized protein M421DRAFT_264518 [Didymella exigua CBS 183.55]KAF1925078.1 hypothetical protein M421DRAFT_264518 [Didymella exigua CBS 183.55]
MSKVLADAPLGRDFISAYSRSIVINIVSWVLFAFVISTLVARFAAKLSRRTTRRLLAIDEVLLVSAALFSFGQTIAISIQWKDSKSERHLQSLYDDALYQKSAYVSSVLFIANMGCAKIYLSLVVRKLFAGRFFEYTSVILAVFTAGWTLSGVLVAAFQCRMPVPWNVLDNECIDVAAFGNYLALTNVATEVLLVLVPIALRTQDNSVIGSRIYVSAIFCSRLSIAAPAGVQLYLVNASASSPSIADSWAISLCMQIAQTLSVISACLPGLNPLVAKDMDDASSTRTESDGCGSRWDANKFGYLSNSHVSQRSVDLRDTLEPGMPPYCHPIDTHSLVRASASCDSYNFPRIPSNIALPLSTPEPPINVFNRLIRSSSSLDLDPLGTPRNLEELGCLPAPDWEDEEVERDAKSERVSPERRPTSEYIFQRSKVISVLEERSLFEIGREWNGFVPPLPTPRILKDPPRAERIDIHQQIHAQSLLAVKF